MDEEDEWAAQLIENLEDLLENGNGGDSSTLFVTGCYVRNHREFVDIFDNHVYEYMGDYFRKGPEMIVNRRVAASVTLHNGDFAVFGGRHCGRIPIELVCCEVCDVESNVFSFGGDMTRQREACAAVVLRSGLVLIVGGCDRYDWLDCCEIYNPTDKTFTPSNAKMRARRNYHTASLLPDGKVIVCGGWDGRKTHQTTEIYDPSTDSFSDGPFMKEKRSVHFAVTLFNNCIFLIGGGQDHVTSTEIYDPAANSFSSGPKTAARRAIYFIHRLPDGRVLITHSNVFPPDIATEIYDPKTNSFSPSNPISRR